MTSEQAILSLLNVLSTTRSWVDCKKDILNLKNILKDPKAEKILDKLDDNQLDRNSTRIINAAKYLIQDVQKLGIEEAIELRTNRNSLIQEWDVLDNSESRNDPKQWETILKHPDLQILPIEFQAEMFNRTAAAYLHHRDTKGLLLAIELWERAIEIAREEGEAFSYHTNLGTALTHIPEKLEQAVVHHRKALSLAPPNGARKIGVLGQLEYSLKSLYEQKNDPALLQELVKLQEQWVKADPDGFVASSTSLTAWMYKEFEQTGKPPLLDGAIEICHLILQSLPQASKDRSIIITNLGSSYAARYNVSGQIDDLEKGIKLIKQAIQMADRSSSEWFERRKYLANTLKNLYEHNGDIKILDEAAAISKDIIENCNRSDENYPEMLNSYASILYIRSKQGDFEKAIEIWQEALNYTPPDSDGYWGYQHNLAAAFGRKYSLSQDVADLEKAENISRNLVTNSRTSLSNAVLFRHELAMILRDRFRATNKQNLLDEAIELAREIISMLQQQEVQDVEYIAGLCELLYIKYESTLQIENLLEAKKIGENVLKGLREYSPGRVSLLGDLGKVFHELYNFYGDQAHLDRAVELFQEAADHTLPQSIHFSTRLNSLANVLNSRFNRSLGVGREFRKQRIDDLNRAIGAAELAVSSMGKSESSTIFLSTLSALLSKRVTLSKTLKKYSQVVHDPEDKKDGNSPLFPKQVGKEDDLSNVLKYSREAVSVAFHGTYGEFVALNNAGACLAELAESEAQPAYLDEAIAYLERAHQVSGEYPLGKEKNATALAEALKQRSKLTASKVDESRAFELSQASLQSHSLSERFSGAYSFGIEMLEQQRFPEAMKAFEIGIDAAKQLLSSQLLLKDKQIWLRKVNELWKLAALAHARCGDLEKAVERIEEGINRQLQETLSLEEYIGNSLLEKVHTDLYTQYAIAIEEWKQQSQTVQSLRDAELRDEQISQRLLTARKNLERCILEIRKLPEFKQFDAQVTAKDIHLTAVEGPIVYIVPSSFETFALIILPESDLSIRLLTLPKATFKDIAERGSKYWDFYDGLINREKKKSREEIFANLDQASRWLWDAVMEPITKELVNYSKATLIPVGMLSFFPLHASWTTEEQNNSKRKYAQDDICLSYSSCARALKMSRKIASTRTPRRFLGIVEPTFSNAVALPFAELEVHAITPYFPEVSIIQRDKAKRESLLQAITTCDVFHFSGHGSSNLLNPLNSSLFLANEEQLTVHDILTISAKGFPLAFLSACETGVIGFDLPEETIGLTSGLQQAGFAAVCSSLWPVQEESTMLLTTQFYRFWMADKIAPAVALQKAADWVKKVTKKGLAEFYGRLMDTIAEQEGNAYDLAAERWSYYISSLDEEDCPFAHPFFWGAFIFNGAGFISDAIRSAQSELGTDDFTYNKEENKAVELLASSFQPSINLPSTFTKPTTIAVHLTEEEVEQMGSEGKMETLLSLLHNFANCVIDLYEPSIEFKLVRKATCLIAKTNLLYTLINFSKDTTKQSEIRLICAHAYATQCGLENALQLFQELAKDESLTVESRLLAAQATGRLGDGEKAADIACMASSDSTIEMRLKAATLICELANIGLWGTPFMLEKRDLLPELGILVPVEKLATEALVAFQSENYASALHLMNECIQGGGDEPVYFFNRGMINYISDHYKQAINDFTQAIARDDLYEKAYCQRGVAYAAMDEHEMAIKDLNHAIELNKNSSFNYEQRGRSLEALGRHQQARADFERAVALTKVNAPEPAMSVKSGKGATVNALSKEKALAVIKELDVYDQICLRLKEMVYTTGELYGRYLAVLGLKDLQSWPILTMIKDESSLPARLRIAACYQFDASDSETSQILRSIIMDTSALLDDRRLAAQYLGEGGSLAAIKAVLQNFGDVYLDFREMATPPMLIIDLLTALYKKQRKRDILTLADDPSMALLVREVAGECLWGLKLYEESIKVLTSVANDARVSPEVCWMAINALKEFGYVDTVQALLNRINGPSSPDNELKRRVRTVVLDVIYENHNQQEWEAKMQKAWQAFTKADCYDEIDNLIDQYPFILSLNFLDYAEEMATASVDSEKIKTNIKWFKMVPEVNLLLATEAFFNAANSDEMKIVSQQYPIMLSGMYRNFVYQGLKNRQIDADMKEVETRLSWLNSLPQSARS